MSGSVLAAWARTVRRRATDVAVTEAATGRRVTFGELDARAEAWCAAHGAGGAPLAGRAVVFAAPNGARWFELFLGLLKAGAVAVPLDPGEPAAAQAAQARVLRAAAWWNGQALEFLDGARRYRGDVCLVKLTSGSTGRPRPLVFTGAQMLADGAQVTATMGVRPRDLNYALIPLGHSYGLGNLTLPLVAQGVPLVCGTAPLPAAIAADFARWQPSVFPGVPSMWRALAAAGEGLAGLRLGISAGAPLDPAVARAFAAVSGRRLHSFYGSSETGGIAYDRTGRAALRGDVGTALRGVTLRPLPGERLRVSSAAVLTAGQRGRAGGHGAWTMPDRVRVDGHGRVHLLGRRGTTVKIAGRRVNLAEVAERLRRLPGVREAWAGLTPGPDPVLAAVVATESPAAALRAALQPSTAPWLIPKKIRLVPALPVTARGKVDVRALRALVGDD